MSIETRGAGREQRGSGETDLIRAWDAERKAGEDEGLESGRLN